MGTLFLKVRTFFFFLGGGGACQLIMLVPPNSDVNDITCGVPRGSLLGPLLFILYINDFQNSSKLLSFVLFADDTSVFYSHKNPNTLVNTVNTELSRIHEWICCNKLSLKCSENTWHAFQHFNIKFTE